MVHVLRYSTAMRPFSFSSRLHFQPVPPVLLPHASRPPHVSLSSTEAFSPERGAREGATKVMIVVTDGESHDGEELPAALEQCEERNITRYAIAVSTVPYKCELFLFFWHNKI